jgi:hypothetical protein
MIVTEGVLRVWMHRVEELVRLKASEADLRRKICGALTPEMKEAFADKGLKITMTERVNRSIDEAALNALWPELPDECKKVIKFKPSIVAKHYNKLPEDSRIFGCITEKPGMPTLKIEGV